jgi:hypothetical protein
VNLQDTLVVLDTCVLMPPRLSDVLMDMRAEQLFSAHWTADIDQEYLRNMHGALGFSEAAVRRRLGAMKKRCPEWEVVPTAASLARVPTKVDAKDRHVAAAALTLRQYADEDNEDGIQHAVYLVTDNARHFAKREMTAEGVTVLKAGAFLDAVHAANPAQAEKAVLRSINDLANPPYTPAELLAALQAHGAKQLVAALGAKWAVKPRKRLPAKP